MSPPQLVFRPLTADDFASARAVADEWFGHPVGLTMHRLFFDQLGTTGVFAASRDAPERMVGCLLGLRSQAEPWLAYIHFHMVDPAVRGVGVGRAMYVWFGAAMHAAGCTRVRALAAPERTGSVRFHRALGFVGTERPGFLGPGQDRIVFERDLPLVAA
ncbi:MAG: GNAT family N-acetyltransferase [Thermoleophilia bacterium]